MEALVSLGVSNMVIAVLWSGGTVITTSSLRPNRWIQLIEEYHVDHIYMHYQQNYDY